jgi:hypothetical protein
MMSPRNNSTIVCVVDTETTFINETPRMVYHFGATFGDIEQLNSFNVIKMDYYVKEVIEDLSLFLHQNKEGHNFGYNKSMARALKDAINNPHKVKAWKDIIKEWQDYLHAMNVQYLTSYNFNFDIGIDSSEIATIRKTHQQLTDKTFFLPRNVDYVCLMDIGATLFMNRNYLTWVNNLTEEEKQQMTTEKGNPSYSAQSCMRYINRDLWYTEQHTALRDSLLEFQLFAHFWGKWKQIIKSEFVNNVKTPSWQHLKKGYSAKKKRELRLNQKAKGKPKKARNIKKEAIQLEMAL